MVIRRLKSAVKFGQDNNELRFGEGDFRLGISGVEKTSVDRQSRTGQIMAEIYSKSQFTRWERGEEAHYFNSPVEGWTTVFAAANQHGDWLSVGQLMALAYVIRTERLELTGEVAYRFIRELWHLTPGAQAPHTRFPEPSSPEEWAQIRLVKFFDTKTSKTSLHFHLLEGLMKARMFGQRESQNIKHLGMVLAGGADIHPHIAERVEEVAVEELDPAELLA